MRSRLKVWCVRFVVVVVMAKVWATLLGFLFLIFLKVVVSV